MVLIKGGPANSGTKRAKKAPSKDWTCQNGHTNRGYATRCLTSGCREKRP